MRVGHNQQLDLVTSGSKMEQHARVQSEKVQSGKVQNGKAQNGKAEWEGAG